MKTRKWTSQQKFTIVLEGVKGKTVAQICSDHSIHQSMYYKWRDDFLSNAYKAFEKQKPDRKINRLKQENNKLKQIIGDLSLELKKNEGILD